ncbi:MAG: DUF4292 domain-containing protein [Porphyromonadaceae bacterium]|nr:DUF4292 domain-containing protein [Porphyromonadaceae bacterium]
MLQAIIKTTRGISLALGLGLTLLGSSCKVRKPQASIPKIEQQVATNSSKSASEASFFASSFEKLISSREGWQTVRATLRGRITLGNNKGFTSRISLQAQRGKGLRLSIQPFPLIEAARLWFTPKGVVLVDLINDAYTEVSYQELGQRLGFTPSYDQVESLILGQIFAPNGRIANLDYLFGLRTQQEVSGHFSLTSQEAPGAYAFDIGSDLKPRAFRLIDYAGAVRFSASYVGKQKLSERTTLPERTELRVFAPKKDGGRELGTLELDFQRVGEGSADQMQIEPIIKPSYQRLSLNQVLKVLENM